MMHVDKYASNSQTTVVLISREYCS